MRCPLDRITPCPGGSFPGGGRLLCPRRSPHQGNYPADGSGGHPGSRVPRRSRCRIPGPAADQCRFPLCHPAGRASYNPAADMKGVLKTRKVEHRSAISQGELPDFLKKLDSYSGYPITKLALRLIVLTFVRTGELRAPVGRNLMSNRGSGAFRQSA